MTTGFALPFTVRSTIHYETGLDHIILLCTTPIDDVTLVLHVRHLAQRRLHACPAEEVIAFDRAIGAEDKRMLERVPGVLPLEQTATVSVQADRASVEWRRRLAALARRLTIRVFVASECLLRAAPARKHSDAAKHSDGLR